MDASASQSIARKLLLEEIQRIVDDARESGSVVRTGFHAARLFTSYHGANFSVGRIVDEIILEAAKRGVPVQMTRPS